LIGRSNNKSGWIDEDSSLTSSSTTGDILVIIKSSSEISSERISS